MAIPLMPAVADRALGSGAVTKKYMSRFNQKQRERRLGGVRTAGGTIAVAIILASLLTVEVARLTVAEAVAQDNPDLAVRLAPNAPASLTATAMRQVGVAAAAGGNPDQQTMDRLRILADLAPLRTEPFLVEAALASREGNYARARQLLAEASRRDPRSVAAHFLTADVATREGNIVGALREVAFLSRLVPDISLKLVPGLSQFVKVPGSREKLAGILADNPQLKNPLLTALADDPDNADLIVSLAGPQTASYNADTRAWQSRLLIAMTNRGEFDRAYDLWRRFARLPAGAQPLLFNGSFRDVSAPQPFNWDFSGSTAGIAERRDGTLRVLFYGREDAELAAQLMILPPGNYRFQTPISGAMVAGALSWNLSCVGGNARLMDLQVGSSGQASKNFTVPASACPAQKLQLNGHAQQSPQDSDVRFGPVSIERIGA